MLAIRPANPADVPQILAFIRRTSRRRARTPCRPRHRSPTSCATASAPPPASAASSPKRTEPPSASLFSSLPTEHLARPPRHPPRRPLRHPIGQGAGNRPSPPPALAQVALAEGCPRLEWDVLAWNTPAIAFYEQIGAHTLTEWRIMRVADHALAILAGLS